MSDAKIKISGLKKAFGKKVVLNGVDLDIRKGESLVVIGGSGTGKSVLIKCIQGLMTPEQGSILVDEKEEALFGTVDKFVPVFICLKYTILEMDVIICYTIIAT